MKSINTALIKHLVLKHKDNNEIAKILGCKSSQVSSLLKVNGINRNQVFKLDKQQHNKSIPYYDKDYFQIYVQDNELVSLFDCTDIDNILSGYYSGN